jgi:phage baseplate assembly protein W
MRGTSAVSLTPLEGWDHVVQSITDILTTPLGSRVLRRDYGSMIPALLDRPMNEMTVLDFVIATADALDRWEPRVRLERVQLVEAGAEGVGALDLDLVYLEDGSTVTARVAL